MRMNCRQPSDESGRSGLGIHQKYIGMYYIGNALRSRSRRFNHERGVTPSTYDGTASPSDRIFSKSRVKSAPTAGRTFFNR